MKHLLCLICLLVSISVIAQPVEKINCHEIKNLALLKQSKPNWNVVYKYYPNSQKLNTSQDSIGIALRNKIGGYVKINAEGENDGDYKYCCALKMSYAMNKAGKSIRFFKNTFFSFGGGDDNNYIESACFFKEWLLKTFGKPEIELAGNIMEEDKNKLTGKKGIIVLIPNESAGWSASGHIDLFNKTEFVSGFNTDIDVSSFKYIGLWILE